MESDAAFQRAVGGDVQWDREAWSQTTQVGLYSPDVTAYMLSHPWLISLAAEAENEIVRIFGEKVIVRYELRGEATKPDVFGIIETSLSPDEAFRALACFDEEWLFRAPTRGRFNVDVELQGDA